MVITSVSKTEDLCSIQSVPAIFFKKGYHMKLEELNPELFTFDKYDSGYYNRLDSDMPSLARKIADVAIGYCDASRLFVRPRRNEYALLCEDEDGKFWFHVDKSFFDKLLEI